MKETSQTTHVISWTLLVILCVAQPFFCAAIAGWSFAADPQEARKLKVTVPPEYPELARRFNIRGTARVQIKISAAGSVTEAKEVGGNPVLLDSLMRAVRKWKYEPADQASTVEVKFDFAP